MSERKEVVSVFYTSMIILSIALCFVIGAKRRLRFGFTDRQAILIVFAGILFGYLGAKILYRIENPLFPTTLGGGSFFGTVIFAPVGLFFVSKMIKRKYAEVLDFGAIFVPIVLAVTRIGCYQAGCCGAAEIVLSDGSTCVPPIQLIESGLDVAACLSLIARERCGTARFAGEQYPVFVIMYSFVRMVTEVYRDTPKNCAGMSEGQWFSVCCAVAAAAALFLITRAEVKKQAMEVKKVKKDKN